MKNTHWLAWVFTLFTLTLAAGAQTPPPTSDLAADVLSPPTNNVFTVSNMVADVRVLDYQGLVLETNFAYLPRIKISDLSTDELRALLETRTAYEALTRFGSGQPRNGLSGVIESQLDQIWIRGKTLPEKIQTRLEILADMRAYNTDVALLPGSVDFANQSALYYAAETNRLAYKSELASVAASQVENAEEARAYGNDPASASVHDARENYRDEAGRLQRASDRAAIANNQLAAANQQVAAYSNACALLSARLTSRGISVSTAPPFSPIPALSLAREVDAERLKK